MMSIKKNFGAQNGAKYKFSSHCVRMAMVLLHPSLYSAVKTKIKIYLHIYRNVVLLDFLLKCDILIHAGIR